MPLVPVPQFLYDASLIVHSSAAKTATFNGEVGGSAKVIDFGAQQHRQLRLVCDITALDIASTDEQYNILFQLSNNTAFDDAGLVQTKVLKRIQPKAAANTAGFNVFTDPVVGEQSFIFENQENNIWYQYGRLKVVMSGTTPSITLTARLTDQHRIP